ncbi:hypothetical protein BJ170DRAFT_682198 [Xylariales sp. AK1849]|nr:hypothetical protein BJ170DRAFT_682198 [Xylariales sp. AK1849]
MAMDDATSLVSELILKLVELEQKVEHHRQDMATEFQRYSRGLLQNVSKEVSIEVEKKIQDSMQNYPALSPALDDANPIRNDSPSSHENSKPGNHSRRWRGTGSPPPLLPHTSVPPAKESPRSTHEREKEFQGLFTPSYLPLLDGWGTNLPLPPTVPSSSSSTLPPPVPVPQVQSGELTRDPAKGDPISTTTLCIRPEPLRRNTEDTICSITSDDSTAKTHRSALRRSSSSSAKAASPRRVRFEVEGGGEVLPTTSPPKSPRIAEHPLSPLSISSHLVDARYDSAAGEDDTGLLGSSPPMPKKITSTDRLKAMTRSSVEDTSNWQVVGDLQDFDDDEDSLVMMGGRTKRPNATSQATSIDADVARKETRTHVPSSYGRPLEDAKDKDEAADFDEDNEDLLGMPALSSFKGRKNFSPPHSPAGSDDGSKASEATVNADRSPPNVESKPISIASNDGSAEEDEDLFDYEPDEDEEGGPSSKNVQDQKPRETSKYINEDDNELGEEPVTTADVEEPVGSNIYSTSPAMAVSKQHTALASSTPSHSTSSRHANPSVGSYKGQPLRMSSVSNEHVNEKAAKMGDIYSFVGSVDGRSGVDESTSHRASNTVFDGTPKSLSQRLMMEEYEEARRKLPGNNASK